MAENEYSDDDRIDVNVLTRVLSDFENLTPRKRETLIQTIITFYKIGVRGGTSVRDRGRVEQTVPGDTSQDISNFSEDRAISPKDFILQKQPRTEVERIACLAYYLTHYRDTPEFKAVDLSKLNTEAAQAKLLNPTRAVDHATKGGYLVQATKGNKQISAAGEQFVLALPNREAAKAAMANARPRRKVRKGQKKVANADND